MLSVASISADFGAAVGTLAGMIAVAGFLAHAAPVLRGTPEQEVRQATVRGGLTGLGIGIFVVVLSAFIDTVDI
jgi:hypothetical protein